MMKKMKLHRSAIFCAAMVTACHPPRANDAGDAADSNGSDGIATVVLGPKCHRTRPPFFHKR